MTPVAQVGDLVRLIEDEAGAVVGEEVTVTAVDDGGIYYRWAGFDLGASHHAYEIVTVAA